MTTESFILDQPQQIHAWQLLAFYHMLKLEIKGMHHSSGRRASVFIRRLLLKERKPAPRNREDLLQEYEKYLVENGILVIDLAGVVSDVRPQEPCPHGFYNYCSVCGALSKVTGPD